MSIILLLEEMKKNIKLVAFIAFIKKEFYHIFRDKRTMLIIIGMPVVQIILFGFAISTEVKNIKAGIMVEKINTDTRKLIEKINANEFFTVRNIVGSPVQIDSLMKRNEIDLGLIMKENGIMQIIADATDPNLGVTRVNYMKAVIASRGKNVNIQTKLLYNPQMKSSYNFVPGVIGLILMLICAMMTSVSIVKEKETGSMDVLLVSPINAVQVVIAKTIPYMLLSLFNLVSILFLAVYVLGVPIRGNLLVLLFLSLLFIFVSLSMGLFISSMTNKQVTALLVSVVVLMIPSLLISGIIYPIESMPIPLQALSCVIPVRWYVEITRKIMIEGVSIHYITTEILVMLIMAVVFVFIASKKINK